MSGEMNMGSIKNQTKFIQMNADLCIETPFKKKSLKTISEELAYSHKCYEEGDYEDFDAALDEISERYGL